MFKILLIVLIVSGVFAYSKFTKSGNSITYPQFPSNLPEVNLGSIKGWSSEMIDKYFPDAASQTAELSQKAKDQSVILLIEAAKKLKPEEFKTLQQFVCEPSKL